MAWEHMLLHGTTLVIAQQLDSNPPFWWFGLFASPGGLLIVAGVIGVVALTGVLLMRRRN